MASKSPRGALEVIKGLENISDADIKNRTRKYVASAVVRLAELANSRNDSVALGASKYILDKFLPDLKATEITGKNGEKLIPIAIFGNQTANAVPGNDSNQKDI
jgi:hypothetical protein